VQPPAGPPVDVLASGRDEPRWSPPPWLASRRVRAAAAALVAVAAIASVAVRAERVDPPVAAPAAELSVVDTSIAVSQGGVLVVPVALRSPGQALRVRSAEVSAAPVRTDSLVTAPDDVPADATRRLAVIVDPDCRVIGPGVGGELVATLVVRVVQADGVEQDLRLAVGEAPAVRSLLEGLCGEGRGPVLGDPDAAVAELLEEEALEVGLEVRMLDLGDRG
jgi:hypothetical protein